MTNIMFQSLIRLNRSMIRATRAKADALLAHGRRAGPLEVHARNRQHLIQLYTSGLMTARILVIMAWCITCAGGSGVADLAYNPATLHDNAARICMKKLGVKLITENCILEFVAPGYDRASRRNKLIKISVLPFFRSHVD